MNTILGAQGLFIGGEWIAGESGGTFARTNPYTGEVATVAAAAGPLDARRAIEAAEAAFPIWAATSPSERHDVLVRAADLLLERAEQIGEAMTQETGATFVWGRFNCELAAQVFREAASQAHSLQSELIPSDVPGLRAMSVRQPVGVVVGIAPWNGPVVLCARALAAPLAFGNTVVVKASERCPRVHAAVVQAVVDAGAPDGVINMVVHARQDAVDVTDELIGHPAVRRVSFTGSTIVGRAIAKQCAENLKRCVLELGGKASLVVLSDADLEAAADAASFGAFINSGQVCMSTERIVIDRAVADDFATRLVARAAKLSAGDPRDAGTEVGPVVDDMSRERVLGLIDDARRKGAELLVGGEADGNVIAPTVLSGVTPEMEIYAEESFGPVVAVVPVDGADEAVRVANDTPYGLAAAVFSGDVEAAWDVARRLDTGVCHINSTTVHDEPQMPFGGMKGSGWGRFGGRAALEEFTELRWMTVQQGPRRYPI